MTSSRPTELNDQIKTRIQGSRHLQNTAKTDIIAINTAIATQSFAITGNADNWLTGMKNAKNTPP